MVELDGLKLKLLGGKFSIASPNADYRWVRTIARNPTPCYMCLNLKTEAEALSLFYRPDVKAQKFDAEFMKSFIGSMKSDLQARGGSLKNDVIEASDIPINGKSFRVTYTIQMPNQKERDRTVYYTVVDDCLLYFQGGNPESAIFKAFVTSFNATE